MSDYWDANPAKLSLEGVYYTNLAYFARVREHHLDNLCLRQQTDRLVRPDKGRTGIGTIKPKPKNDSKMKPLPG